MIDQGKMIGRVDQREGTASPKLQGIATILAAVTDACFLLRFSGSRVKGLMDQAGVLGLLHDFQGFFSAYFFGESLGDCMAGGLAECKAVKCGSVAAARFFQKTPPLATKTISNGDVVKFVDDLFNRLARKNEFLGSLYGLIDRYDLDWFTIFCCPGWYGSVNGGRTIKKWRKRIIVVLNLTPELFQQLLEQLGQVSLLITSGEFNHEFVFHHPNQHEWQQSVDHHPCGTGLIENKPSLCKTVCHCRNAFFWKPA
ncbi:MAG: hypothetical protein PVG51_08135 [Desulfosarcina sp.]